MSEIESVFNDPEVKKHLLTILGSDLLPEQKYSAMSRFFGIVRDVENEVLSDASEEMRDGKKPPMAALTTAVVNAANEPLERVLVLSKDSVRRALKYIQISQNSDGGWGYRPNGSGVWGTAHALLALWESRELVEDVEVIGGTRALNQMIDRGIQWMVDHASEWSAVGIAPGRAISAYEASISVICLFQLLRQDAVPEARATLNQLPTSQNPDGGFDVHIYGEGYSYSQQHVWSEVGATSMMLRAMAEAKADDRRSAIRKGVEWLIQQQNVDGSWNNGSCGPDRARIDGQPSVTKTCDAINGLLMGDRAGIPPNKMVLDNAIKWVLAQEKIISSSGGKVEGWGYSEAKLPDLDMTCLALETLLRVHSVSRLYHMANAMWLISAQNKDDNSGDDGSWLFGDTFRISLGMVRFYRKLGNIVLSARKTGNRLSMSH